ncbi:hypothetical protein C8R48DRAFT_675392 [Suillus tomentosus]|nr:hypothetical protein C8R48DRAFT_675392 [Suillus tomentosus]
MARTSIWTPFSDEEGKRYGVKHWVSRTSRSQISPPAPPGVDVWPKWVLGRREREEGKGTTNLPHPRPRCTDILFSTYGMIIVVGLRYGQGKNKDLAAPTSHSKAITRTSHAAETRGAIRQHNQYVIRGGKSCKSRGDRVLSVRMSDFSLNTIIIVSYWHLNIKLSLDYKSLLLPLSTAMYGSHFNFLEHRNETLSQAVTIRQANQKIRKQDRAPTDSATYPEHHSASSQNNRTRRSLKSGQGYGIISVSAPSGLGIKRTQ